MTSPSDGFLIYSNVIVSLSVDKRKMFGFVLVFTRSEWIINLVQTSDFFDQDAMMNEAPVNDGENFKQPGQPPAHGTKLAMVRSLITCNGVLIT